MKIALIADVHGNSVALEHVLQDAKKQSVKEFIILGDVIMVGPDPKTVLTTLHSLDPACWIKGNTDMWFEEIDRGWKPNTPLERAIYQSFNFAKKKLSQEDISFIRNLPTERAFTSAEATILCVHGSPGSVNKGMDNSVSQDHLELMVKDIAEEIVVCGHTHVPYIGQAVGKRIFNVGSVGRPLDGNSLASYGIIDFSTGLPTFEIRRVYYPIEKTVQMAKETSFPYIDSYAKSLVSACRT